MSSILKAEYPDGHGSIRVVFDSDGGVQILPPNNPRGGTEVVGEHQDVSAIEIARLMNFAYRCGQSNLVERLCAKNIN